MSQSHKFTLPHHIRRRYSYKVLPTHDSFGAEPNVGDICNIQVILSALIIIPTEKFERGLLRSDVVKCKLGI